MPEVLSQRQIKAIRAHHSVLLNRTQVRVLKSYLEGSPTIKRIFFGSKHGFTAEKFHERCDGKGETIAVIQSELNQVFGVYV